jgi:hypothetical protein
MVQEVFGWITPAIARFMPWEPPAWSEYVPRCEKRVQAPEPNKFSFAIWRLGDAVATVGATGAVGVGTVTDVLPLIAPKLAVMFAVPVATGATIPATTELEITVAADAFDVLQVTS